MYNVLSMSVHNMNLISSFIGELAFPLNGEQYNTPSNGPTFYPEIPVHNLTNFEQCSKRHKLNMTLKVCKEGMSLLFVLHILEI